MHAWLVRMATEAIEQGKQDSKGRYIYYGIKFVIEKDGVWPVLNCCESLTTGCKGRPLR